MSIYQGAWILLGFSFMAISIGFIDKPKIGLPLAIFGAAIFWNSMP